MGGARAVLTCAPLAHERCNCSIDFLFRENYTIFNLKFTKFYCENLFKDCVDIIYRTMFSSLFFVIYPACSEQYKLSCNFLMFAK